MEVYILIGILYVEHVNGIGFEWCIAYTNCILY